MDTKEVSDRFVAPCFVNGLEAYDGEINLGVEKNMISNEYAVKLCLEHKFIINPKEDDVEPGVILGRSFLPMTKVIIDFEAGTLTIYPEFNPFLEDIKEEEKRFLRTIGGIVTIQERLFLTFDGFCHQTFRAAISDVMRNVESDSDDEEEYQIKRNKFGAPIYGPKPASYLNTHDDETGSSRSKRSSQHEIVEAVLLLQVYHEFLLWERCNKDVKSRMGCDGEIDDMLRIRLREAESNEEIFTYTYEFDEVCADDELQTKKIIKFRLVGRAHNLILLEFARKLGLYHADELKEDGFNIYFEGGLCSDEHFNAREYRLSISQEENLGLSRSHTSTIRSLILWVIHKMITYGLCQSTTGYDKIQKNDL
nr:hypothetical protein [Tanacetum cinerariifolium]